MRYSEEALWQVLVWCEGGLHCGALWEVSLEGWRGQVKTAPITKQTISCTVESKEKGLRCKSGSFSNASKQNCRLSGEL